MKKYRDHYFCKAKAENYPARSVYKLQELDKKFGLFKKGMKVLDLGAAPGSWSLYAAKKVAPEGQVLAVDIKETDTVFPPTVSFMREDVFSPSAELAEALEKLGPFDVVMSDMAPATTGIKMTDQARSLDLALAAYESALANLAPGGSLVVKIFRGPDTGNLLEPMRKSFASVKTLKPKSSRAESKETFYVGVAYKGRQPSQ